jgi:RHS repeat-associated protein
VVSLNTNNAWGQRVEDITLATTTDEVYGADGELLGRFTGDSNARSFVPFGGGLLAEYFCGGMIFDHSDELGSLTASTDCTGKNVNEKMFYPFGESWTGAAMPNLGAHQVFGKLPDYDAEIDQYNTANRHYSPMGRWMSPDPGGVKVVHLDDPQSWNMYAYARNNPTTMTDPTGLLYTAATGGAYAQEMNQSQFSDLDEPLPPPPPEPAPGPGAQTLAWSSLSSAQQSTLRGGEDTWNNSMDQTARANFAAITHALEGINLGNGATGLSEIKAGSASMRSNGHEMDVAWKDGAAKAFESHGFSFRPGEHGGTNLGPTGMGIQRLHLVLGSKENQVHIDYRGLFEGHYKPYNDDVTAPPGPERSPLLFGKPIVNSERYRQWYP